MSQHRTTADDRSDPRWFATTHWSNVMSAGKVESQSGVVALDKLCRAYWQPLYNYVRRQGHSEADAQDLTQAFFAKLLRKNFWSRANPQKGRFRAFLLTALRQFLSDERDRMMAAKRGGGLSFVSLDDQSGEERLVEGAGRRFGGELLFEQQWAVAVLDRARVRLRQECIDFGKLELLERVCVVEGKTDGAASYAAVAAELGLSISAIKTAVSRLRDRYGELVYEEVARTVSDPAEIEGEIRHLLSVISAGASPWEAI